MKNFSLILPIAFVWSSPSPFRRQAPARPNPLTLGCLKKMDAAAASFRTTQAEFEWDPTKK
jgi:hypothetical protein